MKKPEKIMSRQEMAEVLEEIARDDAAYPSARVSAIRALLEIAPAEPISSQFSHLHEVELRRSANRSR
jgi:hypothetical protein